MCTDIYFCIHSSVHINVPRHRFIQIWVQIDANVYMYIRTHKWSNYGHTKICSVYTHEVWTIITIYVRTHISVYIRYVTWRVTIQLVWSVVTLCFGQLWDSQNTSVIHKRKYFEQVKILLAVFMNASNKNWWIVFWMLLYKNWTAALLSIRRIPQWSQTVIDGNAF